MGSTIRPIIAATVTWDGGGIDNTWAANKKGGKNDNFAGNEKSPENGDSIIFAGTNRLRPNNDILNLLIQGIEFASGAGTFVIEGNAVTFTEGSVTNNSSNLQTINMSLGLQSTITVTGTTGNIAISGQVSGAGGIEKEGSNTLLLTNVNTYAGTTTITTGILLANNTSGSATGTGAVSVSGTFGGTGIIAPTDSNGITVNIGGAIAPGNGSTPGTMTFDFASTTGKLTMNAGSVFQFHLGSPGLSDMLSIVGASSGDVIFNNNVINFMGTGALGSYKIFDTSLNSSTWSGLTFNNVSGQITSGLSFTNLNPEYSAFLYLGGLSNGGAPGDIYVQVIPEPKAALLGGLGVLLLLRRRRL